MDNAIDQVSPPRPTSDAAMSPKPQPTTLDRIGKYDILAKLGQGGMGAVYKGHDPIIRRDVAVKIIHEHALEDPSVKPRFYREARSAGGLSHPNITIIHDVNEENGRPFLVMEYLEGDNLRSRLNAGPPLRNRQKLDIATQICRALLYAHEREVVHRDIKPENIQVLPDGTVKVMDFGIARIQSDTTTLTQTNSSLGTPRYMAPEQVKGEQIDHRADIFSFGVLLHELLSGAPPFPGENLTTIIYQILHTEPQPLELTPVEACEDLQLIVSTCMAKDPDDRYDSFAEVLEDLQAVAVPDEPLPADTPTDKISTSTSRPSRRRRSSRPSKRRQSSRKGWWIALGILLVVGLAAGGLFVFQPAFVSSLTASFPAATDRAAPQVTSDETSAVAALTITPNQVTVGVGDQAFLNIEARNAQGEVIQGQTLKHATVHWNTADSSIAAVAGVSMMDKEGLGGVVTGRNQGKTTVTVALDGVVQFVQVEVGMSSALLAEAKAQYTEVNALLPDATLPDSAVLTSFEHLRETFDDALDEAMRADIEQKIQDLAALIHAFQATETRHQQDSLTIFEKRAAWQVYLDQALPVRRSPASLHAEERVREIDEAVAGTTTLEPGSFVTCARTVAGGSTGALRICRDNARQFKPGTPVYLNAETNAARSASIRWAWIGPDGTELRPKRTRVMGVQGYRIWDVLKASETQQEGTYQIRIYNEKDLLIGRHTFMITP